jgi:hypothetical protein
MCAVPRGPSFGPTRKEAPKLKKTLAITVAAVVLIALATTGALFALNAIGSSYRTCGKVNPSELRKPADPDFARKLEKLARCER